MLKLDVLSFVVVELVTIPDDNDRRSGEDNPNSIAIAGGIAGGILFLIIVVVIIFLVRRKIMAIHHGESMRVKLHYF